MIDGILEELVAARRDRIPCALVTVAATRGSVPRAAGSKMLVYGDGKVSGTIGGGKFESLVIADAQEQMKQDEPLLKTYPLHESACDSFGAICGGESVVLIEPQLLREAIVLVGAGHCAQAIARLATQAGLHVSVIDDRKELLSMLPSAAVALLEADPAAAITNRTWRKDEALILVSRNYEIDKQALAAALSLGGIGYIGMIGSERKVRRVLDDLRAAGMPEEKLRTVYAPVGLNIGADSPAEIAISVIAEVLAVLRKQKVDHLRSAIASK